MLWHSFLYHESSYVWDLILAHFVIISRLGFRPLKSRCDRSGIRGMLTVGRNLDRIGQPLPTYLATLILSKLFLIFSHLLLLYSDDSYLFFLKTKVNFTLWNPVSKVTFRNRKPNLRNKNKTIFIGIYVLECLFLWYLSNLDL
jgi:hypothetical protein